MNLLVDTNVLVFAVHEGSSRHEAAREFLEAQRESGVCLTWSILYEWLRVVTHPRVFSRPLDPTRAREFVVELAGDPGTDILVETPHHLRFMALVLDEAPALRGNLYHDAHIVALMREHGVSRIATYDGHFRLFPSIETVDPSRQ